MWRRYEGGDKVSQVMREVDQVKGVMSENINQAMSNLESTEALNEKTQEMKAQSNMFNKQAKTAKNQMWWKNMKVGSRHAPRPPGPQTRCCFVCSSTSSSGAWWR